jgi:hypothetical protein
VNADTRLNIKLNAKIDYEGAADCEAHHQYTNLHYHGFEVSPKAPQDDVVSIKVKNGESYQYKVSCPPATLKGCSGITPIRMDAAFFRSTRACPAF